MSVTDERIAIAHLKRGKICGLDAQSAFIRAYERTERFDETRPFGPWFLRSVVDSIATTAGQRRLTSALATLGLGPLACIVIVAIASFGLGGASCSLRS